MSTPAASLKPVKSSSSSVKKSSTAATTLPPWADLMKNKKKPHQKTDAVEADDDDAPSHSLPLPEEARTAAAVADATTSVNTGKSNVSSTIGSMSKRRLFTIMGSVLAVVFIVSLSITIAAKRKDEDGSFAASKKMRGSNDSSNSANAGIRDPDLDVGQNERLSQMVQFLSVYSHAQDLETLDTPQNHAAKWLANVDEAQLAIPTTTHYKDAFSFVQRYIIAVLYFSTNGNDWKHADSLGFMSEDSVCDWNGQKEISITSLSTGVLVETATRTVGVACDDLGQVNYIYLPQNNLVGTLPSVELGLLEAMDHFSVVQNQIEGPLPESLGLWKDISILAVEGNRLSGPLPAYLSSFTKLEFAHLGGNQFTGPLPAMSNVTTLKDFSASDNRLTGTIDTFFNSQASLQVLNLRNNQLTGVLTENAFADADNLVTLDLGGNQLSGNIPTFIYTITTVSLRENQFTGPLPAITHSSYPIEFLSVYGNSLSGELPANLGDLSQLKHLDVSRNAFTGRIPSDSLNSLDSNLIYLYLGDNSYNEHHFPYMYSLSNLQELSVRNANLMGAIPDWVGTSFTSLQLLDASHNHLNETIPFELGDLESIRFLMLDHNQLTGMVPTSFTELEHLHVLTLSHNPQLIGGMHNVCDEDLGPQYLAFAVTDCSINSCTCCSYCCQESNATTCMTESFSPNVDNSYQRDVFAFSVGLVYNPHQLQEPSAGQVSN